MMVNFLMPSAATGAWDAGSASTSNYLRIFSDPKPVQTDYYEEGVQLLDFKIDFLNEVPVIWTVFAVILDRGRPLLLDRPAEEAVAAVLPPDEDMSGSPRRRPRRTEGRPAPRRPPRRTPPHADAPARRLPPSSPNAAARYGSGSTPAGGSSAPTCGSKRTVPRRVRTCRPASRGAPGGRTRSARATPTGSSSTTIWVVELPDELHLDVKGWRRGTRRLEAYWNGSVFAGPDVPAPGES